MTTLAAATLLNIQYTIFYITPSTWTLWRPAEMCQLITLISAFEFISFIISPHLSRCFHILLLTFTSIITLYISTGIFPDQFKSCSVYPHLKNLTWTKMISVIIVIYLTCYSDQTLLKVVKLRLVDYLSTNNLINSFKSVSNIILLKLLFFPFMIISSKPRVINKSLVSHFWYYRSLYISWTSFILA